MRNSGLSDDLQRLLPLTPAVFYVLLSLADSEKHGYAIMQEMASLSGNKFRMGPGTLYTTIQRLLDLGLIDEVQKHGATSEDARRRYYQLTRNGHGVLEAEVDRMESIVRLAKQKKLVPKGAA